MKYLQNLHTHSTFCDGKNTPRETVESAVKQGFKSIGFSGHSYMYYDTDYCMTKTGTEEYIAEINSLKKEYADKIEIFLGVEADMYSAPDLPHGFDYKIGSLHFLLIDGEYVEIDRPSEDVEKVLTNISAKTDFYMQKNIMRNCQNFRLTEILTLLAISI